MRAYRQVCTANDLEGVNRRHNQPKVSWHWDDDGSLIISGRLSPEEGALVVKALEVAADNDGGEDVVALTWEDVSVTDDLVTITLAASRSS